MAQQTTDPGNKFDDTKLDPAAREADAIFNRPDMQDLDKKGDAIIRRAEQDEAKKLGGGNGGGNGKGKQGKNDPDNPMGYQDDGLPNADASKIKGVIGRFRNNRRSLIGIGAGGGILLSLVAGFLALIPLKLEMLVKAATEHAAEIPEYAIEHRIQYLLSTYLAQKVLGATSPADTYPGTPTATLFKTWQASRIEDQLHIKITSNRTNNGQVATGWKIAFTDTDVYQGKGTDVVNMTKEISSSKEMSKFLKLQFKQNTKWYQFYKRYAVRKTLMRTKGVTRWAWLPEKLSDKLDTYTAKKNELTNRFKKRLFGATVKRVLPRSGIYLSCLSGDSEACKDIHNHRFGTQNKPADVSDLNIDCAQGDQACADRQKELARQGAEGTNTNANSVGDAADGIEEALGKEGGEEVSKLVTKQLLSKVAAGIGIVDTLARIINSLDNGAINQVLYDRNSIMASGYAAEIMADNDQFKAGKLEPDQFDALMSQIGDYGSSPAWQAEIGILSGTDLSSARFERNCGSDGDKTVLAAGETVCPERKIITDKTSFTTQIWWQPLSEFATVWVKGPGKIFDLFAKVSGVLGIDKAMGAILNATGINSLLAKGMTSMLELVFGSPISATDTGAESADDVLGGIKSTYFALGEAGQDTDTSGVDNGKGLGIGGAVFTPQQTAALKEQIAQENQNDWSGRSAFAKLFDLSDTRSVLSQLVLRTPTNSTELAAFPGIFQNSVMGLIDPQTSAAGPVKDQFGFNFNYGFTDTQLTANPAQYTEDKCKELAKQREDSYKPGREISKDIPIYVYTKADPCALEKVVTAAASAAYDQNYSPDFALDKANDPAPTGDTTTPGGSDSTQTPSAQGYIWPIPKSDYEPLSNCYRKAPNGHTGIDIPVPVGTKVYAASAGKVVRIDTAGSSDGGKYIIIQHANGYWTNYQHLSSISVKEGDTVTAGQNIGLSGNTGNSTGPHLHFSVTTKEGLDSRNSVAYSVNPIPFLPSDGRSLGVCAG